MIINNDKIKILQIHSLIHNKVLGTLFCSLSIKEDNNIDKIKIKDFIFYYNSDYINFTPFSKLVFKIYYEIIKFYFCFDLYPPNIQFHKWKYSFINCTYNLLAGCEKWYWNIFLNFDKYLLIPQRCYQQLINQELSVGYEIQFDIKKLTTINFICNLGQFFYWDYLAGSTKIRKEYEYIHNNSKYNNFSQFTCNTNLNKNKTYIDKINIIFNKDLFKSTLWKKDIFNNLELLLLNYLYIQPYIIYYDLYKDIYSQMQSYIYFFIMKLFKYKSFQDQKFLKEINQFKNSL